MSANVGTRGRGGRSAGDAAADGAAAASFNWADAAKPLVVEVGGATTRIGYAGDDYPRAFFPTSSGVRHAQESPPAAADDDARTKQGAKGSDASSGADKDVYFVGNDGVQVARPGMHVVNPLKGGLVDNWDLLERVWEHGWETLLQADTKSHPMLMIERSFNKRSLREKLCEVVFETYQAPAVFVAKDAVLSCFANARGTAVVYDCGATVTTATPVYNGYAIQKAIVKSNIGGNLLDAEMLKQAEQSLNDKHPILSRFQLRKTILPDGSGKVDLADVSKLTPSFLEYHRLEVGRNIRESLCQISDTIFDREANINIPTQDFHLPDGRVLKLATERFVVPELLMDPTPLAKYDCMECGLMIQSAAEKAGSDARQELFSNVLLAGGNSCYTRMADRVHNELAALNGTRTRIKVVAQPENDRRMSAWLGGSIVGSLAGFHEMWMSKAEYAEHGPGLVDRKCP